MSNRTFHYEFSRTNHPAGLGGGGIDDIAKIAMRRMQDSLEIGNSDLDATEGAWYASGIGGTFRIALSSHMKKVEECLHEAGNDKAIAREIWNGLFEGSHGFDTAHALHQEMNQTPKPEAVTTGSPEPL